jgi:cytochrome c556
MRRLACVTGLVAAVLGLALLSSGRAGAQDEKKDLTISGIMKRLHGKEKGALPTAKAALAADPVDWEAVTKASRPLNRLSNAMIELDPPKGEKEGYVVLVKAYNASAKDLMAAAEGKKTDEAKAAVAKLGMSCAECHKGHKP